VAFVGRHFMITKVRGRFTDIRGSVKVAERFADSSVEVVIGMASVESGNPDRDAHIKSAELFDVEQFPEATFRSKSDLMVLDPSGDFFQYFKQNGPQRAPARGPAK